MDNQKDRADIDSSIIAPDVAFDHESGSIHAIGNDQIETQAAPEDEDLAFAGKQGLKLPISVDEAAPEKSHGSAARRFVQSFLDHHQIEILFDGSLRRPSDLQQVDRAQDIDRALVQDDVDAEWVLDNLMEQVKTLNLGTRRTDVHRALRMIVRDCAKKRRLTVMRPLLCNLDVVEQNRAEEQWQRLGCDLFDTDPSLSAAVLKHFIWQVKQKALLRPVTRHLMPVIYSAVQGSGKTTFVTRFLSPLQDLVPDPVLLSDLADARSGEIFRFLALLVDDMEKLRPDQVPILKATLTANGLGRRKLGSSRSVSYRQRATLIGTANIAVNELVADHSGHRRFATLSFRNGEVTKGGSETVWKTVDALDYELLWQSVDAFAPSPIEAYLPLLAIQQEGGTPLSVLRTWLFDLNIDSDDVLNLRQKFGCYEGVAAKDIYELFCDQTKSQMPIQWFAGQMDDLVLDANSPLNPRRRAAKARYWPVKVRDPVDE